MKKFRLIRNLGLLPAFLLLAVFLTSRWVSRADEPTSSAGKIRVLIVTGGHGFDPDAFFAVFRNNPEITYQAVEHPKAQAWFKVEAAKQYDVVLAYDNYQEISDEAKADFVNLIKGGKGLVVVHHGIGSYLDWPEYWKIMGMRWYHTNTLVDGVVKFSYPSDTDDNHFRVHVVDPEHPVTRGMKDYDMIDETYKAFDVYAGSQPLLTTDCPISNKIIAWAKTYGEGRVVCIQSGHGPNAYVNPNFQTFIRQAIQWTAKKS
jgi:type 1 glutamine amidotransferase